MSKKITIGPVEPLVKVLERRRKSSHNNKEKLTSLIIFSIIEFGNNYFVETEIKTFLKEYEVKRGDRDIIALQNQTITANATMSNIRHCNQQAARFESINQSLRELNEKVQNQVFREDVYQSHRDSERLVKFDELELEKAHIEEQLSAKKAVIDREFQETSKSLQDKYQIVL
ncbi:hypothetical protein PPL_05946 [Heterostelium album PN500]|uniref:Biogenesis of lysosome-related organelles complex 1 subunit 5 n=1 Tax=Heterostelium pallidum (strain ATCC 26659 / Pp 5 / PN500) TaxID=670386 RepID=D3BBS7_HETP5|nr:hypothetical protein PPL_05946 [Heterostelium album PN500]EFA81110.1 hypothetical protein PPL_05946 [Heterostelium album PN500]|eukprot:XP_020433228.1 hypothetical protein PPL_05946 [Heterostelium album PN500]